MSISKNFIVTLSFFLTFIVSSCKNSLQRSNKSNNNNDLNDHDDNTGETDNILEDNILEESSDEFQFEIQSENNLNELHALDLIYNGNIVTIFNDDFLEDNRLSLTAVPRNIDGIVTAMNKNIKDVTRDKNLARVLINQGVFSAIQARNGKFPIFYDRSIPVIGFRIKSDTFSPVSIDDNQDFLEKLGSNIRSLNVEFNGKKEEDLIFIHKHISSPRSNSNLPSNPEYLDIEVLVARAKDIDDRLENVRIIKRSGESVQEKFTDLLEELSQYHSNPKRGSDEEKIPIRLLVPFKKVSPSIVIARMKQKFGDRFHYSLESRNHRNTNNNRTFPVSNANYAEIKIYPKNNYGVWLNHLDGSEHPISVMSESDFLGKIKKPGFLNPGQSLLLVLKNGVVESWSRLLKMGYFNEARVLSQDELDEVLSDGQVGGNLKRLFGTDYYNDMQMVIVSRSEDDIWHMPANLSSIDQDKFEFQHWYSKTFSRILSRLYTRGFHAESHLQFQHTGTQPTSLAHNARGERVLERVEIEGKSFIQATYMRGVQSSREISGFVQQIIMGRVGFFPRIHSFRRDHEKIEILIDDYVPDATSHLRNKITAKQVNMLADHILELGDSFGMIMLGLQPASMRFTRERMLVVDTHPHLHTFQNNYVPKFNEFGPFVPEAEYKVSELSVGSSSKINIDRHLNGYRISHLQSFYFAFLLISNRLKLTEADFFGSDAGFVFHHRDRMVIDSKKFLSKTEGRHTQAMMSQAAFDALRNMVASDSPLNRLSITDFLQKFSREEVFVQ